MRTHWMIAVAMAVMFWTGAGLAETVTSETGGDVYIAGETVTQSIDAARDVFAAGRSVTVLGRTEGDFHGAGFDVLVDTDVGGDVYAAGATVTTRGEIAGDLTAAGFTVRHEDGARVSGNARLMGATVVVDGAMDGALVLTGGDVVLNGPVAGDARVFARNVTFGPEATIAGNLIYTTEDEITVPERVIPGDRVTFRPPTDPAIFSDWDEWEGTPDMPVFPSAASVFFGFLVTLLFFVVLGAIALGIFPDRVSRLRKSIARAPGTTLLLGVLGLSALFGSVLVTGMTIVGLLFVPIAILTIVVVWTLAYALGAYAVAMWVWIAFGGQTDPSVPVRLIVLAVAISVVAVLNFIPFVGWIANYTLVLLGVGAMTRGLLMMAMPQPLDPVPDLEKSD